MEKLNKRREKIFKSIQESYAQKKELEINQIRSKENHI